MQKKQIHLPLNRKIYARMRYNRQQFSLNIRITTLLLIFFLSILLHLESVNSTSFNVLSSISMDFDSKGKKVDDSRFSFNRVSSKELNISSFNFPGFTENRGQLTDADLLYYFQQDTYFIGFYLSHLVIYSRLSSGHPWEQLTISFSRALPCVPSGQGKMNHTTNYFTCTPKVVGVTHWREIWYYSLYPGISLRFYSTPSALKYEFHLDPYADPEIIQICLLSSQSINVSLTSSLVQCYSSNNHELILWEDRSPIACQSGNVTIPVEFVNRNESSSYGFALGNYDPSESLIIDPVILMYSTYLGGTYYDFCDGSAMDNIGCVYITGAAFSSDFPMESAYNTSFAGLTNIYISKLAPNGHALLYSTYFGGSYYDHAYDIAIDAQGYIYILGVTSSPDFPLVNPLNSTKHIGEDGFLTKFAPDGQSIVYSTYFTAVRRDHDAKIAVDASGCAYIGGTLDSMDVFCAKIASDGSQLDYFTVINGSKYDYCRDITIDTLGSIYLTGFTSSPDFPLVNPYQSNIPEDDYQAFGIKLNAENGTILYSTFLGGSGDELGYGIAVDALGRIYVTGLTCSNDFPLINAYSSNLSGEQDLFITQFTADGQSLIFSTYFGGSSDVFVCDIGVDSLGCISIAGTTSDAAFPIVHASDATYNGRNDVVIAKFAPNGESLLFSTYYGGSFDDDIQGMVVDFAGAVCIVGETSSDNLPLVNTINHSNKHYYHLFLAKLDLDSDGDFMPDGWEIVMHLDPHNPNDGNLDYDSDGLSNRWECNMGLNATDARDAALDLDGDGLTNFKEFLLGSNPWLIDSDHDRWKDPKDFSPANWWFPNTLIVVGSLLIGFGVGFYLYRMKKRKRIINPSNPAQDVIENTSK